MDKGLAILVITCVAVLALSIGYHVYIGGSPSSGSAADADNMGNSFIVDIALNGDLIEVSEPNLVYVQGSKVTISSGGTYRITGSLHDGQIIVYTDSMDPVRLILNGVNINCSTGAPISIMKAEEAFIILADGTENFVQDAAAYVYLDPAKNEPDAAIFCKSDLTIMGNGVLNVIGNHNDGIASKDGLVIQGGIINVRSVDDGIRGRDYIIIKGGILNLIVGGDGLKSDNPEDATLGDISVENGTINIVSGGDAFQVERKILINSGSFKLKSGGGSSSGASGNASTKGIKGLESITINGGFFEIDSADDAIHSNGKITVNAGYLVLSSGNDAVHADGPVEINGGDIHITRSFEGVEGAAVSINGGNLKIVSSDDGIDAAAETSGIVSISNCSIEIISGGDAIQAENEVSIMGGAFKLVSGGGSISLISDDLSAKGIKGAASVKINSGTFLIDSADDAVHSNGNVSINGGTLILMTGDDAVHADGSIRVNGGNISITKSFEGIEGASVTINNGIINIISSDDGIDTVGSLAIKNGEINIKSVGDAVQAGKDVLITGGNFNIISGNGCLSIIGRNDSAKGIKAAISVTITGGAFRIDSADDAIHSDGMVTITGGSFTLLTGDDTIRACGSMEVTGGDIKVLNSPGDFGKDSWDSSIIVDIMLKGNSIEASCSHSVYVSGNKAMIRSAGIYRITGSLSDGQIIVNTRDKGAVKLILSGAHISCSDNAPICVLNADEVVIFLEAGTDNVIVDGNKYVFASPNADEPNAAVFSRSNMTIMGEGTLRVTGNYNDGIASKDGLTIMNGVIFVNSVDDGIRGKDYLIVKGGSLTLSVSGDGLKSDNSLNAALGFVCIENGTINIVSGGDAIQAETNVLIHGGNFNLKCGGGSDGIKDESKSAKGVKGAVGVTINNGVLTIDSADDAVHSDGTIMVNAGALTILTGDDGIHAEKSITINNGKIDILKSFEGIEAPIITINDGEIHVVSSDDGINLGVDSGVIPPPGQPGARFSLYSGDYYLYINGGYIAVNALGDGIDSNGAVVMNGGVLIVDGPSSDMNSALDHVAFNITRGYLIAVGSSGMALPPGDLSAQYSVMLNFRMPNQAGTLISVRTSNGTELFTFKPTKRYQSIVFSTPDLTLGSTYDVYVGGSHTGTIKDGLYISGAYIPGTKYISFKITNKVTQIGPSGGFFFPPR